MADEDHHVASHRAAQYRRTVSFGDCPQPTADDDVPAGNKSTTIDEDPSALPDDGSDYVCAPLVRTNNRPSAATCWLVHSRVCVCFSILR